MSNPNPLDITGTRAERIVFDLSPDAQAALAAAGVPVPEPAQVTLLLREATMRERTQLERDQQKGGRAQTDPLGWLASLLERRAEPGTDPRVLAELVQDFGPTDIAMLVHAYATGVLPDPKVTAAAVQTTLIGTSNGMLAALASAGPSPS